MARNSAVGKKRALDALMRVLPRSFGDDRRVITPNASNSSYDFIIHGTPVTLRWAGEGWPNEVRPLLRDLHGRNVIVAAKSLSPGARAALEKEGISWVDETGAANIVAGPILISRTGQPLDRPQQLTHWTPAVQSVAEALLCGTRATVAATQRATSLSSASCTKALRFLTDEGLLVADAARGRNSARRVEDSDRLLAAYASAAAQETSMVSIQVGIVMRDLLADLAEAGAIWDGRDVQWSCTGAVAASVIAPYLSSVTTAEVYIAAETLYDLESAARMAGFDIVEGGRLTLRPFPTTAALQLSKLKQGVRVAPWPRVYADLRQVGVRGEEAAEHLREVIYAERERAES